MKKEPKMNLGGAYEHYNRNVGRVVSINDDETITANINPGHGGGEVIIPIANCYEFVPKIQDRVYLCVDLSGTQNGYFLMKLPKSRQELRDENK